MPSWRERIQAARERGSFTAQDRKDAAGWCTCAVGEQRRALPDVILWTPPHPFRLAWKEGGPVDDPLETIGAEFGDAVVLNDFSRADRLLDAIEDRALALKRAAGADH
jgi:hypothetical protein